ncbi:MAG: hypothetical protein K0S08_1168 [Gammaproteobacteria bacterium]|jgi:hypothetical protein|nr:hypothetical protein [Gammaproteobacteria bacterium]
MNRQRSKSAPPLNTILKALHAVSIESIETSSSADEAGPASLSPRSNSSYESSCLNSKLGSVPSYGIFAAALQAQTQADTISVGSDSSYESSCLNPDLEKELQQQEESTDSDTSSFGMPQPRTRPSSAPPRLG